MSKKGVKIPRNGKDGLHHDSTSPLITSRWPVYQFGAQENVLDGTKCICSTVLYQINVLGGTFFKTPNKMLPWNEAVEGPGGDP